MPPPPPPDERADARAKINPQFIQMDAALRAAIVAAGVSAGGHPRINATIAEDAGLITPHIARDVRLLCLLVDLVNLDFDLDMESFLVQENRHVTHQVLAAL